MYPVSPQAYDRAITVFSPDGRLFQVEYAKEAVKRGATAVGILTKDAVVFVAHKAKYSKLIVSDSAKKIFEVDDHIMITASGLVADARRLVDIGRLEAQKYRLTYNEAAPVETIARAISDNMQLHTHYGGVRPFGVSLLIGGMDSEPRLFEAEPSGAMTAYKADSIGSGKKDVDEFLEDKYRDTMKIEEVIELAIKGLKKTEELKETIPDNFEIAVGEMKTKTFRRLTEKEIEKYI